MISNSEARYKTILNRIKDGTPSHLPTSRPIQEPNIHLIKQEFIDEANAAYLECANKVSQAMASGHWTIIKELRAELDEIRVGWTPTDEEVEAIRQIRDSRLNNTAPKETKTLETPLTFWTKPDITKGETAIMPNPALRGIYTAGYRHSGAHRGNWQTTNNRLQRTNPHEVGHSEEETRRTTTSQRGKQYHRGRPSGFRGQTNLPQRNTRTNANDYRGNANQTNNTAQLYENFRLWMAAGQPPEQQ